MKKKNQLIQCLDSLTEAEKKRFHDFVASPYFNQQPRLLAFYQLLTATEKIKLDKRGYFSQLWPGEAYHDQRMRDIMSKLFGLLKQFLMYEEQAEDDFLGQSLLLRQLKRRRLVDIFRQHSQRLAKKLAAVERPSRQYWRQRLELHAEEDAFFALQGIRRDNPKLQEKMYALDRYYLIEKFQTICEMLNRQQIVQSQGDMPLLEELIEGFQKSGSPYLQEPVIGIYLQVLLTFQDKAPYSVLEERLPQLPQFLSEDEARVIYKYAQNHCIRQSNAGKQDFLHKLFLLYQLQLQNKMLFIQGKLQHTDFKNIVTVSLRLKEFDWAFSFIEQYRDSVAEPYREHVYRFCLANYYYEKGNLSAALAQLHDISYMDILYQISARVLLLKIYFRQEDLDALTYSVKAFEAFLKRDKSLVTAQRQAHLQFLRWLKKLVRLREKHELLSTKDFVPQIHKFTSAFDAAKPMTNKAWLQAEVKQLEGS